MFFCLRIFHIYVFLELSQLTGAAAILRYPMPDLDDQIEGDDGNILEDERDDDNGIVFND